MNIKQLNKHLTKILEDYGEDSILYWADTFEEIGSRNNWSTDYLTQIAGKYVIAIVSYDEAGNAVDCDRSAIFDTKEDALKYYEEILSEEDLEENLEENTLHEEGLKLISSIKTFMNKYQNEIQFEQYPSIQKAILEIENIIK